MPCAGAEERYVDLFSLKGLDCKINYTLESFFSTLAVGIKKVFRHVPEHFCKTGKPLRPDESSVVDGGHLRLQVFDAVDHDLDDVLAVVYERARILDGILVVVRSFEQAR